MKFCFFTLGCKVNQFETQSLMKLCRQEGHTVCENDADAVVINTCTVTSVSDKKNIRAINKLKTQNPNAIIALCGCFSQISPEKASQIDGVDIICGTENRADVIRLCQEHNIANGVVNTVKPAGKQEFEVLPSGVLEGRTRALLKVQDGCDNFCSYCIIPYARGRVRSLDLENAVLEVQKLQNDNVGEIIITGIEISSYGKDFETGTNLIDLIEKLCNKAPDIRFRLGSLEPRTITQEFCKRLSVFSNLAKHFHLSLQSGCDSVLSRMNRKYNTADFAKSIKLLREYFDDPSITTDVIVGFPNETEDENNKTYEFCKQMNFADMHVFPYSVREGTKAASMDGQIDVQIKNARAEKLKELAENMRKTFLNSQIGTYTNVIIEQQKKDFYTGHGDKDFSVKILSQQKELSKNQKVVVKICELQDMQLICEY